MAVLDSAVAVGDGPPAHRLQADACLTSVASARTASRSAFSKRMAGRRARRRPARWSGPARPPPRSCRTRRSRAPATARKPLPYAISTVTATMPQTMPSIVSTLRVRLRRERVPGLDQHLLAARTAQPPASCRERLDRIDGGRARLAPGRAPTAARSCRAARRPGSPTTRSAAGRRRTAASGAGSRARTARTRTPAPAPPLRNTTIIVSTKNCRTIERRVAPTALRTPISRVRSRTATSITFITPMPPMKQRRQADRAQEVLHAVGHLAEGLRLLDRVPDPGRLLVPRVEAVDPRRARARTWRLHASCCAIERGCASSRSTECGVAGGLFGKSRRIALNGTNTLRCRGRRSSSPAPCAASRR